MSTLPHTDPARVLDVKVTPMPYNPSATGYGRKIPTHYMLRYRHDAVTGRYVWHRVYVMQYANSGSCYILIKGVEHFLDIDTEYRLMAARDAHADA